MADVLTPKQRSYNMSQIHGKNTRPEEMVRKYLFLQGFRYRKNVKNLPGKPDIVLAKYRVCIFVNGCFWHKHEGCKYFVWPKSNEIFWREKIIGNVVRDQKNYRDLVNLGWRPIIVWECQLKKDIFEITMRDLIETILQS